MAANANHTICPYCKESIKPGAVKCRYCGSVLLKEERTSHGHANNPETFVRNALKDRYEIISMLGKGGMATVYKARQLNLGRVVALKVIHPNLVHDQEFVDRFIQEARVCASLTHHNIIRILDFGSVAGVYYMGMELLEGDDLGVLIKKKHRISASQTLSYVASIASALSYIHQKGYMHRDVKPSNIFITREGRPVLMDFGIVWAANATPLTVAGTLLGTPQFLSPEQAIGNKAVPESDFYALGIVMYECLTGAVPFNHPNPAVVINKIINEVPPPPASLFKEIPRYASDITMGLLQKVPERRIPMVQYIINNYIDVSYLTPAGNTRFQLGAKQKSLSLSNLLFSKVNSRTLAKILLILLLGVFVVAGVFLAVNSRKKAPFLSEILTESEPSVANEKPVNEVELTLQVPEQTRLALTLIETELTDLQGVKVMRSFVSEQLWNLVMEGSMSGSSQPATNFNFDQVATFVSRLNAMNGMHFSFDLPDLDLVKQGHALGIYSSRQNEWVSDPPVFPTGNRPGFAKYYFRRFNDEAGENRSKRRNDIYFRLVIVQ